MSALEEQRRIHRWADANEGRFYSFFHGWLNSIAISEQDFLRLYYAQLPAGQVAQRIMALIELDRADLAAVIGQRRFAEDWTGRLAAERIQQVEDATRKAIRNIVSRAYRENWTIDRVQGVIQRGIGLTDQQLRSLDNFRQGLIESQAKPSLVDLRVRQMSNHMREVRAATIAKTEVMLTANMSQLRRWQESFRSGIFDERTVGKRLVLAGDERVCAVCRPQARTVIPITASFTGFGGEQLLVPPLHTLCRCTMVLDAVLS